MARGDARNRSCAVRGERQRSQATHAGTRPDGLPDVTVDDIVSEVGVSRRTFSNYFANKEEALAAVPLNRPFRGPATYARGEYVYHCLTNGDFDWFEGYEEFFSEGERVYECRFHGGAIL